MGLVFCSASWAGVGITSSSLHPAALFFFAMAECADALVMGRERDAPSFPVIASSSEVHGVSSPSPSLTELFVLKTGEMFVVTVVDDGEARFGADRFARAIVLVAGEKKDAQDKLTLSQTRGLQ
jgi:hypothetical protein